MVWFGYNRNNKDHSALIPSSNIEKKKLQYFNSKFCSQFAYSIFFRVSPQLLSLISKLQHRFWFGFFFFFFCCPRDYWSGVFLVLGSIWLLTVGLLAKMGSSCRPLLKINPNIKRQNKNRIRLMCALSFLFLKIFSWELKKLSLLFQFSKKKFPKMKINVCPKGTH